MIEHPILFTGEMVRAILSGQKTQTRRVVKQVLVRLGDGDRYAFDHHGVNYRVNARCATEAGWANLLQFCPYGRPGDRLWVREAWSTHAVFDHVPPRDCPHSIHYWADEKEIKTGKRRPSIHMPRWASRITLEITGVRVDRLHGITVSDAIAEGYDGSHKSPLDPSIAWYSDLWESINGPGSWRADPWVWVVGFKRVDTTA